ncbi:mediator of RNA polymerase II transcription subunit 20-like [Paramacrobiotus metropolitanus]|uniref:mediator of RNA polymerase II transcription subunit 20-like n=1 Tax=Paramacrobiotus metropolitanus TaxID=2943436 RepID=UPI00244571C3|nr:mediator of RNA polymerase II transcription subunit 20-like [Paramacrobiotus metropolitanus]XP_055345465.1 mediator of RNA polymerase II transcription subunit 20-like [Paramacrobiotus metropolitanus]
MGVSWVLVCPVADGKTPNQALDEFCRQLVQQGFEKDPTPFTLKCETYSSHPQLPLQKAFHAICDSDRPASCFLIAEKDPLNLNITAERSLMAFIGKLDKAYGAKKSSIIEVQGFSFLYRDFIVRPGVLSHGGSARGLTVDVELRACPVAINALELMREFVNSFMPLPVEAVPAFFNRPGIATQIFSVMDTMLQYLEVFAHVKRTNMMPLKT